MIVHNFDQNTPEWVQARCGLVTASRFGDVMTVKQMKPAKNAYIYEICAERITGAPQEQFVTEAMKDGIEREPKAIEYYEFLTGKHVDTVGLITNDSNRVGASPDGLIDDDGGLEIKCPTLKTHLEYIDKGILPDKYIPQVYGSLYLSGREYWDFLSYHPDASEFMIRTTANDEHYLKWKAAFEPVLSDFISRIDCLMAKIQGKEAA